MTNIRAFRYNLNTAKKRVERYKIDRKPHSKSLRADRAGKSKNSRQGTKRSKRNGNADGVLLRFFAFLLNFLDKGAFTMTYPEIIYQHLQNIIQREINYTTRDKMVKSPQRKRIVTLQDVANALLYFEGGSLAKELKRAGLDMTPSAFIQRR